MIRWSGRRPSVARTWTAVRVRRDAIVVQRMSGEASKQPRLSGRLREGGRVDDCFRRLSPMPVPHSSPWLRFQSPLIEPDMRISRIRLSDEIMPSPTGSSPCARRKVREPVLGPEPVSREASQFPSPHLAAQNPGCGTINDDDEEGSRGRDRGRRDLGMLPGAAAPWRAADPW